MRNADDMPDVDSFVENGFLKVDEAAPRETAEAARQVLWTRIGLSQDNAETWTQPVVWTADLTGEGPFGVLARSHRLAEALDALCGAGGWQPRGALGVLGEQPIGADECGLLVDAASTGRDVALATGVPGDMYVVHPFTVHAADEHRGRTPRFMAQAPVLLAAPLDPQTRSPLASAWHRGPACGR